MLAKVLLASISEVGLWAAEYLILLYSFQRDDCVAGQNPCLLSATQRQNKRIVFATENLNPLFLILIVVGILGPEAGFMTRALLSFCH